MSRRRTQDLLHGFADLRYAPKPLDLQGIGFVPLVGPRSERFDGNGWRRFEPPAEEQFEFNF